MPYPSTRFSSMDDAAIDAYEQRWLEHLRALPFAPDVIHTHHVWLLSSLVKDVWPGVPVLNHCHATGLRQMELCPRLVDRLVPRLRRNERFAVLTELHRDQLIAKLGVESERISIVGAGFREDLFSFVPREPSGRIVYAGKYSEAKGQPAASPATCRDQLLDAVSGTGLRLHVAGAGTARSQRRMEAMPEVTLHGRLEQPELAQLFQRCDVLVLPSFYEGLPLVLVEALATGCRLVSTALPSVVGSIAPRLHGELTLVPMPRLMGIDVPEPADLPAFVDALRDALLLAKSAGPLKSPPIVAPFTWRGVYERVAALWEELRA